MCVGRSSLAAATTTTTTLYRFLWCSLLAGLDAAKKSKDFQSDVRLSQRNNCRRVVSVVSAVFLFSSVQSSPLGIDIVLLLTAWPPHAASGCPPKRAGRLAQLCAGPLGQTDTATAMQHNTTACRLTAGVGGAHLGGDVAAAATTATTTTVLQALLSAISASAAAAATASAAPGPVATASAPAAAAAAAISAATASSAVVMIISATVQLRGRV